MVEHDELRSSTQPNPHTSPIPIPFLSSIVLLLPDEVLLLEGFMGNGQLGLHDRQGHQGVYLRLGCCGGGLCSLLS